MTLHLSLLGLIVVFALIGASLKPGHPKHRPWSHILLAVSPFLVLAVLTRLLLSAPGSPVIEWLVPLAGVLVVGFLCKSNTLFTVYAVGAFVASLVLCGNYILLVHGGGYTGRPSVSEHGWRATELNSIRAAEADLQKTFREDTVVPEGPVATLVGNEEYNHVERAYARRTWHTWLTGLYAIERHDALVWCQGGEPGVLHDRIVIREKRGAKHK
ncbi:hypothetical protein [Tautonia sociabilis]|uniref:Uncharacterized protein n=1 Tax=Tautonia sociabilis TaxID=2080755 RepID=A0A432MCK4_9BACT|nr:hypothetical protein [Tautonia sociabilis]RUL81174.1 hypothetical protein TsocGM_25470 [Tautonia sociabilis]